MKASPVHSGRSPVGEPDAALATLKGVGLTQLLQHFRTLPDAQESRIAGQYAATFVGPWWLRTLAPLSLPLVGLRGWCGKHLIGNGHATNLRRQGTQPPRECVPMQTSLQPSRIDGRPTLALTYPPGSPLLLRFFIDELRPLNDHTLMGVTTVDLPLLRRMPLPFLLSRPQ